MMPRVNNPLTDPAPPEVRLPRAPLVRVLCQVSFPTNTAIGNSDDIAPFQKAIRKIYENLEEETIEGLGFSPTEGFRALRPKTVWRFKDSEEGWTVSLSPDFVSLETTVYDCRDEFVERLQTILEALLQVFEPAHSLRVGLRFVNRVVGDEALGLIGKFVHPDVVGMLGVAAISDRIGLNVQESAFKLDGAVLQSRWGLIPPHSTIDPSVLEPLDEPSWVLDLDMYRDKKCPLDVPATILEVRRFSERLYSMFRWLVTDDFLRHYGGVI